MENTTLLFVHLHKSGGTSFCATLAEAGIVDRTTINCNTYFDMEQAPQKAHAFPRPHFGPCDRLAAVGDEHGARCCRWRHAGHMTAGISFCEPGHWMGPCNHGFDPKLDLACAGLQYGTIVRQPLDRIYSHMCQHHASRKDVLRAVRPGATQPKLPSMWRYGPSAYDNYFVRALAGGDAWLLPAGRIGAEHLARSARSSASTS